MWRGEEREEMQRYCLWWDLSFPLGGQAFIEIGVVQGKAWCFAFWLLVALLESHEPHLEQPWECSWTWGSGVLDLGYTCTESQVPTFHLEIGGSLAKVIWASGTGRDYEAVLGKKRKLLEDLSGSHRGAWSLGKKASDSARICCSSERDWEHGLLGAKERWLQSNEGPILQHRLVW